jgi:hypothetical protein
MSEQPPVITLKYKKAAPAAQPAAPQRAPVLARKQSAKLGERLFRVAIVTIILVSMGLAYWSFFHRLMPLQTQARDMINTVTTTSASLDELERRWPPERAAEIRAQYREVYSRLFADQAQVQDWLGQLHALAAPLDLEIAIGFGQSTPNDDFPDNLAVIPASVSLEVLPAKPGAVEQSPYERLMAFSQALAAHGKRADLGEFTVIGGAGSVNRALLTFSLWAGDLGVDAHEEPEPEIEASTYAVGGGK